MDFIEKILDLIVSNFNFSYMITINVLTYIIIKGIDYLNKDKNVKTITKRIVLVISIIIVTISYILTDYQDYTVLINSAICAGLAFIPSIFIWGFSLYFICYALMFFFNTIRYGQDKLKPKTAIQYIVYGVSGICVLASLIGGIIWSCI